MQDVHIYDIASSTWYTQTTTTDYPTFPADRIQGCAVAATAPDKSSYNIYVHGGYRGPPSNRTLSGGVWVLTLPTFHWIYAPLGNAKAEHTCAKIHEKFMVVHRGARETNCDENAGLMILDMVSLAWVTKIDVDGGDVVYRVPDLVSKVIGGK